MKHIDQRDFEVAIEIFDTATREDVVDWWAAAKIYVALLIASPLTCALIKWAVTGKWPVWVQVLSGN